MKTLTEYMKSRGTPLTSIPSVGGKKLHPFFLYALVARYGGSSNVTSQNQWSAVGQKLGLAVEQHPQLLNELIQVYRSYLLPFEIYASTPDGQRDLQNRRQMLQKQQEQLSRQRQDGSGQSPASQGSPLISQQSSLPTPLNSAPQLPQQINQPSQSRLASQPPTPAVLQQRPNADVTPYPQQGTVPRKTSIQNSPLITHQVISPSTSRPASVGQGMSPSEPSTPTQPNVIRNYVPEQRLIDYHGGYDVKMLSQVGEQIDTAKPIFLFAPELGTINIHALTMSLCSDIISEVNTALNTILVTSADSGLAIPLAECPEFLDAISTLGSRVLDKLLTGDDGRTRAGVDEVDLDNLDVQPRTHIDDIFKKYVDEDGDYNEVELQIDSFSGQPLKEGNISGEVITALDVMDFGEPDMNGMIKRESTSTPALNLPDHYLIPSYFEMLTAVRSETEHPFSTIHTRTSEVPQVLLIDQLTTISMILRNISFTEYNANALAVNDSFRDFLFGLVRAVATHGDRFLFTRRRLGFLKDSLIILTNIAHLLELRCHNEALAVIAVVLSFGSDNPTDENLLIPDYVPSAHKYLCHGIDVLAKLLVRESPNRALFHDVMTGVYSSTISPDTVEQNKKLVSLYIGDREQYTLITDVFKYMMSVIPLNTLVLHPLLQERDAAIMQSLLALILVVDMIPTEHLNSNIALQWLTSVESIGNGLTRLGLLLAPFSSEPNRNETLKQISSRALTLVNTITEKALSAIGALGNEEDKSALQSVKLHLPPDAILGSMLSTVDPKILDQILALSSHIDRINKNVVTAI